MKFIKNTKGFTLVELLAVIVIASIVLSLTVSILQFTSQQKITQTKDAKQLTDASYALKVITKDIRKSTALSTSSSSLTLTTTSGNITYELETIDSKKNLIKQSSTTETMIENIGCFYVDDSHLSGNKVNIRLSTNPSITDCTLDSKEILTTTIQIRNG